MRRLLLLTALLVSLGLLAAACGDDDTADDQTADTGEGAGGAEGGGTLTVYSGRSEELVGALLERFGEETGIDVEVRYGDTAEMAAQILEEGERSPADVYFGQDAGALGALAEEGRLLAIDDSLLGEVDAALRSPDGEWVGTSGRARVVAYNTEVLSEDDVPDSILDFTDPEWAGRIGWAPTNGSFQSFVTALRVLEGEDAARTWLQGILANGARSYENNTAVVEAVAAGEVDVGFVNHYYLYRFLAEDPDYPVANKYYSDGDPGALVNVAGVGVVDSTDSPEQAEELVAFLLSPAAQEYFATETFEIPLVEGVEPAPQIPDVSTLTLPRLDLTQLADLEGTLALLAEVGAI